MCVHASLRVHARARVRVYARYGCVRVGEHARYVCTRMCVYSLPVQWRTETIEAKKCAMLTESQDHGYHRAANSEVRHLHSQGTSVLAGQMGRATT